MNFNFYKKLHFDFVLINANQIINVDFLLIRIISKLNLKNNLQTCISQKTGIKKFNLGQTSI